MISRVLQRACPRLHSAIILDRLCICQLVLPCRRGKRISVLRLRYIPRESVLCCISFHVSSTIPIVGTLRERLVGYYLPYMRHLLGGRRIIIGPSSGQVCFGHLFRETDCLEWSLRTASILQPRATYPTALPRHAPFGLFCLAPRRNRTVGHQSSRQMCRLLRFLSETVRIHAGRQSSASAAIGSLSVVSCCTSP